MARRAANAFRSSPKSTGAIMTRISFPYGLSCLLGDPLRGQPAGHASHGACFASPPFGDHQAQGCGR